MCCLTISYGNNKWNSTKDSSPCGYITIVLCVNSIKIKAHTHTLIYNLKQIKSRKGM